MNRKVTFYNNFTLMNRILVRYLNLSHGFDKQRDVSSICADWRYRRNVNNHQTIDKLWVFQCKVHHRPAAHRMSQHRRLLNVSVLEKFRDIFAHGLIRMFIGVRRVSVVSGVNADDFPRWIRLLCEGLAQAIPTMKRSRNCIESLFIMQF